MEEYIDLEEFYEKQSKTKKQNRTRVANYEKKRSKAELYLERRRLREMLDDETLAFDHW